MIKRLPRWQHIVLMALCAAGLVAAIANLAVADTPGARGLHALLGLLFIAALVRLVSAYLQRQPGDAEAGEPAEGE